LFLEASADSPLSSDSESPGSSESEFESRNEDEPPVMVRTRRRASAALLTKKKPSGSECSEGEKKKPRLPRSFSKQEIGQIVKPSENSSSSSKCSVKTSDHSDTEDPPKGRDFDLNEIRSELKGIDKAVMVSSEVPRSPSETKEIEAGTELEVPIKQEPVPSEAATQTNWEPPTLLPQEPCSSVVKKEEPAPDPLPPSPTPATCTSEDVKEDIYEFKEPEPFDFQEVRRPIRMFEDVIEKSPEKSFGASIPRVTSPLRLPTVENKEKDICPQDDTKNRFRKISNKHRDSVEDKKKIALEVKKNDSDGDEENSSHSDSDAIDKSSPEPPCLIPCLLAPPPIHSPNQHPPLLTSVTSDICSSDSELDERLVIANEDDGSSYEVATEQQLSPAAPESPIDPKIEIQESLSPEPSQVKRSCITN